MPTPRSLLPLAELVATSPNCKDCLFRTVVDPDPQGHYHSMCSCGELLPLITDAFHYTGNTLVRCNETREFNFACGHHGLWFVPKGEPLENTTA